MFSDILAKINVAIFRVNVWGAGSLKALLNSGSLLVNVVFSC
jgi:hypothetical protein